MNNVEYGRLGLKLYRERFLKLPLDIRWLVAVQLTISPALLVAPLTSLFRSNWLPLDENYGLLTFFFGSVSLAMLSFVLAFAVLKSNAAWPLFADLALTIPVACFFASGFWFVPQYFSLQTLFLCTALWSVIGVARACYLEDRKRLREPSPTAHDTYLV